MIGKVQQDSFPCLRIRIDSHNADYEPHLSAAFNASPAVSPGESLLPRGGGDCRGEYNPLGGGGYEGGRRHESTRSPPAQPQPPISRYKTEMCRPFQDTGVCKYGEKCQFAHGSDDLRAVNRHPKYKTDMCRTYHSVGFCPYGPRCHFIHALDELRPAPATPEKKPATPVKQLPMFGGPGGGGNNPWSFPGDNNHHHHNNNGGDMRQAVKQLNNFFNMHGAGRNSSGSSSDSSRSGSFCSDLDSPTSTSPPPSSSSLRLPIFSRLA